MLRGTLKFVPKPAGLAVSIIGQFVIDEARRLRIASITHLWSLGHWWKILSFTHIPSYAIAFLDHVQKLMSYTTNSEDLGDLKVIK